MATNRTPNQELKNTIKDLIKQSEKDREFIKELQDESNNLELALKKCIHSKAELNDKIEQLQDDLDKYVELYASTSIVAQSLAEAVYHLTKEKTHG